MTKPSVCILRTDGTNCDEETSYAFSKAGGQCSIVHVNELRSGRRALSDYQILAIPGGFSYGDDVVSGKILAVELLSFLGDQLWEFMISGKLIIGICNGFQVLVRTGLLPFNSMGRMQATLADNAYGGFHCGPVKLGVERSRCIWTAGMEGQLIELQVAHGEGKFYADRKVLGLLEYSGQVPLRYVTNPNGSLNDIAAVCDIKGRVLGLMPHPERFVEAHQHPNWRRIPDLQPQGLPIFQNGINFAVKNL